MAKRAPSSARIERKIKALTLRVSFLERALKPVKRGTTQLEELSQARDHAEESARNKALRDYYHQKKVERYLRSPSLLAADLAYEHEVAEFLKSKGLKPEPSRIPEQFHRGLKGYRPKPRD